MPKKVSKSILQKQKQAVKQSVIINMPHKSRTKRVIKSQPIPLNTATMLSSNFIPSGYIPQMGNTFHSMIPQSYHALGRKERTIDDAYSNVSDIKQIKADPKPIVQPIDQPMAYDNGFINKTESQFMDNAIRRMPQPMEQIPIPHQGMASMIPNYSEKFTKGLQGLQEQIHKPFLPFIKGGGGEELARKIAVIESKSLSSGGYVPDEYTQAAMDDMNAQSSPQDITFK